MNATGTTNRAGKLSIVLRVVAAFMAVLLVACFQGAPISQAYAAKDTTSKSAKSSDTSSKSSSKEKSDSASKDSKLSTPDKKSSVSEDEEEEESEEEKEKREEAEAKRAQADSLYAQADAAQSSLSAAEAKFNEASAALDEANEQLDAAKVEYDEKSVEIQNLQDNLSEYVVDMYKQGGATPYLDVMLRSTNYREFLTSWNMTQSVGNYGHDVVIEKKQLRQEIEEKLATCEEQVKEAEKAKKLADSNMRQINATRLALLSQAAQMNLEAAELEEDDEAIEDAQAEVAAAQKELEAALTEGLAGDSMLTGTGYFTHPCPNSSVSSGFGFRSFDNAVHKGIDFAAPEGTPYYAADSGKVIAATNGGGDNGGAGNWIVIDHGNGLVTKYMHSLVTFVKPGDVVERGQNIGLVGTTGQSTGPHLHFQVETNGTAVNPAVYL